LKATFETLGINIELQDDLMIIHGGSVLKGGVVHSHHDHRIAMAAAVAALNCSDMVTIEEAEAINKSFPDFYSNLLALSSNQ
jgi:3-phosphoshikimate 1-carboxyvinyltransferase